MLSVLTPDGMRAQDVKGVAQTWRVLQRNAIWNPGFKEMY